MESWLFDLNISLANNVSILVWDGSEPHTHTPVGCDFIFCLVKD